MLFKQWNEVQDPRHVLSFKEPSNSTAVKPLPELTWPEVEINKLLVLPGHLQVLTRPLNLVKCGVIKIQFPPEKLPQVAYNTEYDEEVVNEEAFAPHAEIPLYKGSNYHVLYESTLEPLVSNLIAEKIGGTTLCITMGNTLEVKQINYGTYPSLVPPEFVSGLTAALLLHSSTKALVLPGDGAIGFAKTTDDAMMEAAKAIGQFVENQDYLAAVTRDIRNVEKVGLYI